MLCDTRKKLLLSASVVGVLTVVAIVSGFLIANHVEASRQQQGSETKPTALQFNETTATVNHTMTLQLTQSNTTNEDTDSFKNETLREEVPSETNTTTMTTTTEPSTPTSTPSTTVAPPTSEPAIPTNEPIEPSASPPISPATSDVDLDAVKDEESEEVYEDSEDLDSFPTSETLATKTSPAPPTNETITVPAPSAVTEESSSIYVGSDFDLFFSD